MLLVAFWMAGCAGVAPLPSVDLAYPGWVVREGQAVWRRDRNAPELAGELLLATRADGRAFVQFSKNPFPLIVAQRTTRAWELRVPTQNRRYSGPGAPPKRIIWFWLPDLVEGQGTTPQGWTFQELGAGKWRLENSRTGEALEGYLSR